MPLNRKEALIISAVIEEPTTVLEPTTAEPTAPAEAGDAAGDAPAATQTFRDLGVDERIAEALTAGGIVSPFPIQAATIPVALSGADVIGQAKTGTGKTLAFGIPVLQRMGIASAAAAAAAAAAIPAPAGEAADAADAAGADQAPAAEPVPHAEVPAPRGRRGGRGGGARTRVPGDPATAGRPLGLIVVPTRELAVQVTEDLAAAGKVMNARVLSVYGGRAYEPQIAALQAGVDVVVGTPGRLLDLAKQHHLDLSAIRMLVLDEADEMLDLGFLPDVERIVTLVPADRQTLLFSATMPGQVIALARQYMSRPTHIRAADPHDHGTTVANITQHVYRAHALDKTEMLAKMLQARGRGLTMVFCRTKRTAAKVAEELDDRGYASAAVHGDLGQGAREQALRAFRNGKVDVLVATDVAARGIDVEGVTHVVNFQCPEDDKTYLHRIGRTGRAGASGTAVTFVDWDEVPRWNLINKTLGLSFHEPAETYSTSEKFHTDLDIPAGSRGRLPKAEQTRAGLAAEEIEDLGETGRGAGSRAKAPRTDEPPARPKRERTRTRTRNGRGGEGQEALAGTETIGAEAAGAARATFADGAEAGAAGERPRRQRTRSRRGPREGGVEIEAIEIETTEAVSGEAASGAADGVAEGDAAETPKRSRTRSRGGAKGAEAAEPVETAAVVEAIRAAEAVQAVPADGAAVVETAPAEAEAPADKPKRTRTRKSAAATAEAAEPAPVATGAPVTEGRGPGASADRPRTRTQRVDPRGLTATGEAVTGHYNS